MVAICRKLLMILVMVSLAYSVVGQDVEEARGSLQQAEEAILSMEDLGLSTERVGDIYESANSSFVAQQSLENPDYSRVISESERVIELKDDAITLYDSISAFNETFQEAESEGSLDLTRVEESYSSAVEDFRAERYSEASEHLEEARRRLSSARSAFNRARAFYDATTSDFIEYVRQNTVMVTSGTLLMLLILAVSLNEYSYLKLARKVEHLERREQVVEELMEDTEKSYYVDREMDEANFKARKTKYLEMLNRVEETLPVHREKTRDKRSLIKYIDGLSDF